VNQREGAGEDHGDDADEAHLLPVAEFCESLKMLLQKGPGPIVRRKPQMPVG
jgi:hypothetical protein